MSETVRQKTLGVATTEVIVAVAKLLVWDAAIIDVAELFKLPFIAVLVGVVGSIRSALKAKLTVSCSFAYVSSFVLELLSGIVVKILTDVKPKGLAVVMTALGCPMAMPPEEFSR